MDSPFSILAHSLGWVMIYKDKGIIFSYSMSHWVIPEQRPPVTWHQKMQAVIMKLSGFSNRHIKLTIQYNGGKFKKKQPNYYSLFLICWEQGCLPTHCLMDTKCFASLRVAFFETYTLIYFPSHLLCDRIHILLRNPVFSQWMHTQ